MNIFLVLGVCLHKQHPLEINVAFMIIMWKIWTELWYYITQRWHVPTP